LITTVSMVGLTCCGLLVFIVLGRSLPSSWDYTLFIVCIFLGAAFTVNTEIGERHLLSLIILLLLLVLPRIRTPIARWYAWAMAVLGVGYYFYWIFLKYGAA
ncbi:MAG TPA: hypothetical protein VGR89_14300, partial [Puia sp.]|nr:hypothetical protein [Puia sp.]